MDTKKNILLVGGTGLVGVELQKLLKKEGHEVGILSRSIKNDPKTFSFVWDPNNGKVDQKALEWADGLVILAGAGVADKKWTAQRKKEISSSRVESTELLVEKFKATQSKPQFVVAASAIGYYGYDTGGVWKQEGSRFGDDFLATVTKNWEHATAGFEDLCRLVQLRIGIVLSNRGGAYEKIKKPIVMGAGAPIGSGDQYMSWIHVEDLCRMILYAADNKAIEGTFNAVGPEPVTNKEFTKKLAKSLNKPCFLPGIPAILLKLTLGEMASMVIGGSRISAEKIQSTGFEYKYPSIEDAFNNLRNRH